MIDLLLGTIVAASITFLIDRYNTKKANEQREHYNERACYDDAEKEILKLENNIKEFHQLSKNNRYINYVRRERISQNIAERQKLENSIRGLNISSEQQNKFRKITLKARFPSDVDSYVDRLNNEYIDNEIKSITNTSFLKLNLEQKQAVVSDEVFTLVIAGAGSGKTRVIVEKINYLVNRMKVLPEEILLISFTAASAKELRERLVQNETLKDVKCNTFHSFGLSIIKTKYNKTVLDENKSPIRKIVKNIFDNIDKNDAVHLFKYFAYYEKPRDDYLFVDKNTLENKFEEDSLKSILSKLKQSKRTHNDEKVKSPAELEIANFLFENGIKYEYEKPLHIKRQTIHPDFYLPEYDIWIEHFGIHRHKNDKIKSEYVCSDNSVYYSAYLSNKDLEKYVDDMRMKEKIFKGKKIIKTYQDMFCEYSLISYLKSQLEEFGVQFYPISHTEKTKAIKKIIDSNNPKILQISAFLSNYISLFKATGGNIKDLQKVIQQTSEDNDRKEAFFALFKLIYYEYEKHLSDNNLIDFNDMILIARDMILKNDIQLGYKYIIVDEFQDFTLLKTKILKEICETISKNTTQPTKIFCVGDDCQSIYGFLGGDPSIFKNFDKFFEQPKKLYLSETFRHSQQLVDIATKFIQKNPSHKREIIMVSGKYLYMPAKFICKCGYSYINSLKIILKFIKNGKLKNKKVLILGRYNEDLSKLILNDKCNNIQNSAKPLFEQDKIDKRRIIYNEDLDMKIYFSTIHKSKGLEEDNVILLNMIGEPQDLAKDFRRSKSFPSNIPTDPILRALFYNSDFDTFPFAEERRLFYVAMTRTKNYFFCIVPADAPSEFFYDIEQDFDQLASSSCNNCQFQGSPACLKSNN